MIETTFGERQGDRDAYVVRNHRNAGVNFTLRISDSLLYRVNLNCGGTKLYMSQHAEITIDSIYAAYHTDVSAILTTVSSLIGSFGWIVYTWNELHVYSPCDSLVKYEVSS